MTPALILGVVVVLMLVLGAAAVALDIHYGTPSGDAWRRPDLAVRRVLEDLVAGPKTLPRSDWAEGLGSGFAEPRETSRRRQRIEIAGAAVANLKARLGALAPEPGDHEGPAAQMAAQLHQRREEAIQLLEAVLEERDAAAARLTIVLFGRTKAGKSSLFAALTGEGFDGIGNGRQNYTTEIRAKVVGDVEIVDSPGINGVGSAPLEVATERAVYAADVLVVQVTDDALYLEDFERLAALGNHERPVVVSINIKKGDTALLVSRPDRVFRPTRIEPYVERLRDGLPETWADAPVVVFHALGAVTARKQPRRLAPATWEASRVTAVIEAITDQAMGATEYACRAPDEALHHFVRSLTGHEEQAGAKLRALTQRSEEGLREVKAILREVRDSKSTVYREIDDHFVAAEEQILQAITDPAEEYSKAVHSALGEQQLLAVLQDHLNTAAQELNDKYEEFRADVRLATRISLDTGQIDAMHEAYQEHVRAQDEHGRTVKRRRIMRIGSNAVFGIATFFAAEIPPLAVAVAATGIGVDRALADPAKPADDNPRARQRRVRKLLAQATEQAKADYAAALDDQVIARAEDALVVPAQRKIDRLLDLSQSIEEALLAERRLLNDVEKRLEQHPQYEGTAVSG